MSGQFMAMGDAIGEDLAAYAAGEITEPRDVEDDPRAVAAWLFDAGYTVFRAAERLEQTGIRPDVPQRLFAASRAAVAAADEISDLTSFSLAGYR